MPFSEQDILRILMKSRDRIAAAAWIVVRDAHAAEDIFQNVAIKALTSEVSFDSEGAVLSWAFVSARRAAIDWLRRQRNESSTTSVEIIELLEGEWVAEAAGEDGRSEALRACLQALPSSSRELLRLRYFEGLPCVQISDRLRTKLNAVYKRLSRLHQALKECIDSRLQDARGAEA
jgi:RNA polymerase sigma-70 factor (ECF subfamily)